MIEETEWGAICGPGPMRVASRKSLGIKWCFRCRSRREFVKGVEVPTTEEGWYWGPTLRVECTSPECGAVDGDLFPGQVREWE